MGIPLKHGENSSSKRKKETEKEIKKEKIDKGSCMVHKTKAYRQ